MKIMKNQPSKIIPGLRKNNFVIVEKKSLGYLLRDK